MLAVLKYVYRETIATTTEMAATVKVLIAHINTLYSWLTVIGSVSITNTELAPVLSVTYTETLACSLITQLQ